MNKDRIAQMALILDDEDSREPPSAMPPVVAVPYSLEGMLSRGRRFVASGEPDREYMRGICVRANGWAWATNGRSAARLPVAQDVPEGLHVPGAGWVETKHSFPIVETVIASAKLDGAPVVPVSTRYLRALCELAIAHMPTDEQADGYPCPTLILQATPDGLAAGAALLVSESSGLFVRRPSRITPDSPTSRIPAASAVFPNSADVGSIAYDARYVVPALISASPVVGLSLAGGKYSPLLVTRSDGEIHVVMPLRQSAIE